MTTSVRKARPHVHVHETQTASSLRSRTRPTYYSRTTGPLDSPYLQGIIQRLCAADRAPSTDVAPPLLSPTP